MVWAAIGCAGVIGPYFLDESVTGNVYLDLLQTKFWPEFCSLENSGQLIFMQDGAPPHWSRTVRNWLNQSLPHRWIGRGNSEDLNITWPPRSPDLTPCDFFLWGYVKSQVYTRNYDDINDLKAEIRRSFNEMPVEMLRSTFLNFEKRLEMVVQKNGAHIE